MFFGDSGSQIVVECMQMMLVEIHKAHIDLSNELSNAQIGDRMQKLWPPRSWLFNLPPWGCKLYDDSSSSVTFWTFGVLDPIFIINRPLWPHFVFILTQMSIAATSLPRYIYHHSSCCIYSLFYFCHLIEYVFIAYFISLQYVCIYNSISIISFCSHIPPNPLA